MTEARNPGAAWIPAEPADSEPDGGSGPGGATEPRSAGFHMPAEWHPHAATWLTWPKNAVTWPDRLVVVEEVYLDWIRLLAEVETVCLLVDDPEVQESVAERVAARGILADRVQYVVVPTVDSWIRDYGPNFLVGRNGKRKAFNRWHFNAWGGKYPDLARDSHVPDVLAERLGLPVYRPGIVLEGGSIEVDGQGMCLTTRQCLLNPNRNPHLDQAGIENYLRRFLGVDSIVWLNEGILGDDTDGHIDDIARFTGPDSVLCAVEEDPSDANFPMLQENFELLKQLEAAGRFRVDPLVMPDPVCAEGDRLPASYANFYIANGLVCVPVFRQPKDVRALAQIQAAFPRRRVVGLPADDLVWGLGTLHCLSQQEPALIADLR